jgi:hypothetical protein
MVKYIHRRGTGNKTSKFSRRRITKEILMRHTSLLEYVLIALVVALALSVVVAHTWPAVETIIGNFQLVSKALAGTK